MRVTKGGQRRGTTADESNEQRKNPDHDLNGHWSPFVVEFGLMMGWRHENDICGDPGRARVDGHAERDELVGLQRG